MTKKQIDDFLAAAERMHLADYVRFESDRKRRLQDAFWQGVMRGVGAVIGFAVIGALIIFVLQHIAKSSLPGISSFVAQIIEMVRLRLN